MKDGTLIRKWVYWREFDVSAIMVIGILLGKGFWVVNTWWVPVWKQLKRSTSNFAQTFLTDCYTKLRSYFFPTMSYSFFIAMTRRVLKGYFAWKRLKLDYSKNTWKEENHEHHFVCLFVSYIPVKKKFENCNFVGARAVTSRKIS